MRALRFMPGHRNILVGREEIARAGGVREAVEEVLSLAALGMTPRAMTAYEAVGMKPSEADGAGVLIKVQVENEAELREAIAAGAEAVALAKMNRDEARRLCELAKALRADAERISPQG
jgi:hypothetical protein